MNNQLIIIVGPTASGKSTLALRLAATLGAEIISADSQQVYRYFNIGTAKLLGEDQQGIPHHLIDIVDPHQAFSAAKFVELADGIIADLKSRDGRVVVVGGTGLYVKALLYGLFQAPPADPNIREIHRRLWQEQGPEVLYHRLTQVDPLAAGRIAPQDFMRISRALEVFEQTGVPISSMQQQHRFAVKRHVVKLLGLAPERELLRQRIDERVDDMMNRGWLEEVKQLIDAGYGESRPMGSLGYRQLRSYLSGEFDWAEAVRQIKRDTWRFARRQLNWFSSENNIHWYQNLDQVEVDRLIGL